MSSQFSNADARFMARAIRLAERGRYTTQPNPIVGCVMVKDGEVIAEGWHKKAGEPHAERNALAMAGEAAAGATAYVTLEPCSHYGRTPPCSLGLIEAGVARVVAAMTDPNPQVGGKGIQMMRDAGIQVDVGLMDQEASTLNRGFYRRMAGGLPWVRCKLAMSMDGRTAMASGESKWITGPDARADVQLMRAASAVVLTGIGTVLADDPSMNVRLGVDELHGVESEEYLRQPIRAVLDSRLQMPINAKMLGLDGRTLIFCAQDADEGKAEALQDAGAEVIRVDSTEHGLDLLKVMQSLSAMDCNEVMIEAGATLSGAALQAGIVDELVIYQAAHLMGDAARGLVHLPGLEKMSQRVQMKFTDVRKIGDDIRVTLGASEKV